MMINTCIGTKPLWTCTCISLKLVNNSSTQTDHVFFPIQSLNLSVLFHWDQILVYMLIATGYLV